MMKVSVIDADDKEHPEWAALVERSGIIPQMGALVDFPGSGEESREINFISYTYRADGVSVSIFLN